MAVSATTSESRIENRKKALKERIETRRAERAPSAAKPSSQSQPARQESSSSSTLEAAQDYAVSQVRAAEQPAAAESEGPTEALGPQDEMLREAQVAYQEWGADPEGLVHDLEEAEDLNDLSEAEYLALAQLAEEDELIGTAAQSALDRSIEGYERFGDIPTANGFQRLLHNNQNEQTFDRVVGLLDDHLASSLDDLLDGREGDQAVDQALASFGEGLSGLVESHPAVAPYLEEVAAGTLGDFSDAIEDGRRADDSAWQRAGNFVGDLFNPVTTLPALGGLVSEAVGSLGGGALDLLGADGLADDVRNAGEAGSEFFDDAVDFTQDQIRNGTAWLGEQLDHNLLTAPLTAPLEGLSDLVEGGARLVGADGFAYSLDQTTETILEGVDQGVSTLVNGAAGIIGDGVRFVVDAAGELATQPLEIAGEVVEQVVRVGSDVQGAVLDAVGAEGAAEAVRQGGDRLADGIEAGVEFSSDQTDNFFGGLGEAAAGTVEGIGTIVTEPGQVVAGLGAVIAEPELLLESFRPIYEEHGIAGIAGAVAFEVLTEVVTGGGAAGVRAANLADNVADIATAANLADNVADVSTAANLADNVGDLATTTNALDELAGLSDEAAGLSDEVVGFSDELSQTPLDEIAANALDELRQAELDHGPLSLGDNLPDGVTALDDSSAAEVLARTELEEAPIRPGNVGDASPAFLDEVGLGPRFQASIDGQTVSFSQPYSLGDRTAVVGYVTDADGVVRPRAFYRSNSQGNWRVASHSNPNGTWYGKGHPDLGEISTNLPIELQRQLSGVADDAGVLQVSDEVANQAFLGSLETGGILPPRNFLEGFDEVTELGSGTDAGRLIDPSSFRFNDPGHAPNFEGLVDSYPVNHPLHGQLDAHVFRSLDDSLEYLFYLDGEGRAWVGQVDNLNSPVNEFGVRSNPVDPGDLTQPALEYYNQIPDEFRGPQLGSSDYFDGSAYTQALPPVRDFLNWLEG